MKYYDCHCHFLPAGIDLLRLNLSSAWTHEEVLRLVEDAHRRQPDGWLLATQYDQTKYDGVHLTRFELDEISRDRPILLRHSNGHASVANSAALAAASVSPNTPDPSGGTFRRDASGEPDGVLFEIAHEIVTAAVPKPTTTDMVEAIVRAGESMAGWGIAGACDMQTGRLGLREEIDAYLAARDRNPVNVRLYVQWQNVFGPRGIGWGAFRTLTAEVNNTPALRSDVKIAGVKIFSDGAIASGTAAIYGSYEGQPAAETSGQLIYSPEKLTELILEIDREGFSSATHAIGDYATDLVVQAIAKTSDPTRHRIEHAMLLSDEQIARIASLDIPVTFQPEFLMRFGHAYRRQLGARGAGLFRFRSVLDAGIRLGFSSDRPIVPGNPIDGIRTAVNRPEGFDPRENISQEEAERAYGEVAAVVGGF